jgi:hypothetical protein
MEKHKKTVRVIVDPATMDALKIYSRENGITLARLLGIAIESFNVVLSKGERKK